MADITREEAKEQLLIAKEDWWEDDGYGHPTESFYKMQAAFDMAISDMERVEQLEEENKKLKDNFYALKTWECQLKDEINLLKKKIGEFKTSVKDYQKYVHNNIANADSHDFIFERVFEDIDECLGE